MKKKCDNRGFSLIELIITVTILAIIAGASIIAFGGIFSTKVTAASKSVQDTLKQARIDALGLENGIQFIGTETVKAYRTGIYAKFYCKKNGMYVDVCTNDTSGDITNQSVLHSRKVSNDQYDMEFWKADAHDPILTISADSNKYVKLYFKKSTGGVAGYEIGDIKSDGTEPVTSFGEEINYVRIVGPGTDNTENVYIVTVTGRSYVDS